MSTPVKDDSDKSPVVEGFLAYFPEAAKQVALASRYGKKKYGVSYANMNWMGLNKDRIHNAMIRHVINEKSEGLYDQESGLLHAAHAAWGAMAYLELLITEEAINKDSEISTSPSPSPPVSPRYYWTKYVPSISRI